MSKKLFIVESPGKTKKLSQILGADWIVKASMGHVRELASDGEDKLGFSLQGETIECRFVPRGQKGLDTIKQLQAAARRVDTVVLATDPDREGETIAFHLKEALRLRNPQRVVYSEITATAVRSAIANPRGIDMDLVNSGLARACLDKLVGFRGSSLLWSLNTGAKSMGRVQSATLHILCQRERQILAFVPQTYWSVYVDYQEGFRAYYQGTLSTAEADEAAQDDTGSSSQSQVDESERVLSESDANRLVEQARQHPHKLIAVEGKTTTRTPPAPFTTSTLQQAAGSYLRFSPEQTMQVAQKLYEAGLITYMRTDSVTLSPDFCTAARQWLETHDPENVPNKVARHRSAKGAQEAHEAIRPTDLTLSSAQLRRELSSEEFSLYLLIWKRAIASQCQAARLLKTQLLTRSGEIHWQAKGQLLQFSGYSRYWPNLSGDSELPTLVQGQSLQLVQVAHDQKQTQPPSRFSEPKLVQVMERQGIGRPSTYAPTIATLKRREYVEPVRGYLRPTALGLDVDQFLAGVLPDLLEAQFTAQMEQTLDSIAGGKEDWQKFLTSWNQTYFTPALEEAKRAIAANPRSNQSGGSKKLELSRQPCPQCSQPLVKVPSSKVAKKYFLKCTNGCEGIVLFWSDYRKQWQPPRSNGDATGQTSPVGPTRITQFPCPACKAFLEEYSYTKEGQVKQLLRCSAAQGKSDKKHKDVVYFQTTDGWWSPKLGNLPVVGSRQS